ncbi:MAG: hypothetical protein ACTHOU_22215, partial [Aureliella sp.]
PLPDRDGVTHIGNAKARRLTKKAGIDRPARRSEVFREKKNYSCLSIDRVLVRLLGEMRVPGGRSCSGRRHAVRFSLFFSQEF